MLPRPRRYFMSMSHAVAVPAASDLLQAAGVLRLNQEIPAHLTLFVSQADRALENVHELVAKGEMSADEASAFAQLLVDAAATVLCHPIVATNRYLQRFAQGVTLAQARHECQQFSVFAAQFDVAQAKLVANAPTLEAYLERLK